MLKSYQTQIVKDTLYAAVSKSGKEQINPTIEAMGGAVTFYTAQNLPTSAPLTNDMNADPVVVDGLKVMLACPNYILFSGDATSVVVSGLRLKEVV